jgi:hypothetical protein
VEAQIKEEGLLDIPTKSGFVLPTRLFRLFSYE